MLTPKPHVSAALSHLRLSVTALSATLGACIVLQVLVWAFVHYTDARWTESAAVEAKPPTAVVVRPTNEPVQKVVSPLAARTPTPPPPPSSPKAERDPAEVNRVLSRNDRWFAIITELAQTVGVVCAVTLALMMMMGVVVAGGAAVPGVERAVTATTWSIVIALLCLPMHDILPSLPYKGIFNSYGAMTHTNELIAAGDPTAPSGFMFFCQHLVIPLAAVAGLALIVIRFHSGVEEGVIVTSVSELDEKLEREISSIKLGAVAAPRAIGALNRAIGDEPVREEPPEEVAASLIRRSGGGRQASLRKARGESLKSLKDPDAGDPLTRPI